VVAFYFPHRFICSERLRSYIVRIWHLFWKFICHKYLFTGQMSTSSCNINSCNAYWKD
jgi:hypothetical protein